MLLPCETSQFYLQLVSLPVQSFNGQFDVSNLCLSCSESVTRTSKRISSLLRIILSSNTPATYSHLQR